MSAVLTSKSLSAASAAFAQQKTRLGGFFVGPEDLAYLSLVSL
jgi:hypothetical protein